MSAGADAYASLVTAVGGCRACADVSYTHLLGDTNGPLDARLLVVGEAPGRDGAVRTGVPFHGDRSGDRFEELLAVAGLARREVFVTNAILCHPGDGDGRNRRPRATELAACASYLEATLDLVAAPIVVALGGVALEALGRIEPHGIDRVSEAAGQPRPWGGRTLMPLVHPSARTQGRRSWAQQLEDWRRLGRLARDTARVS
jgi:uracil-DNA glycosylase family 4